MHTISAQNTGLVRGMIAREGGPSKGGLMFYIILTSPFVWGTANPEMPSSPGHVFASSASVAVCCASDLPAVK